MRYCKIIKDYSIKISEAQKRNNFNEIEDLQPYIEGIIWSTNKLNIKYLQGFNNLIFNHFGPQVYQRLQQFNHVDYELKKCFDSIEPSPTEIKDYLDKFLIRYNLRLKDYTPMESYGKQDQPPKPNNGPGNNFNQDIPIPQNLGP